MRTVAIAHPGELGAAIASALVGNGVRVISCARDRSEQTQSRAKAAGCEEVATFADLVGSADVFISVVAPVAAIEIAEQFAALAGSAPPNAIYVDLNSISPQTAQTIASIIGQAQRSFVDGAINGLASRLQTGGTLFLSSERAADVATLLGNKVRTRIVGENPGAASAMKMLLSGLSKGVCALVTETALVAEKLDMLPQMLDAYELIYPGIMQLIDRMLPTYAQHADRRATEMRELESTAEAAEVQPRIISAIRETHEQLAEMCDRAFDPKTVQEFIKHLAACGWASPDAIVKSK
jgi:3-hydroxyisobutyrate dehydrogenase-like beta-hydroxyacid dehydrogenase